MAKEVSVREIMCTDVVTGSADETVLDIANKMKRHHIGVVVITDKKFRVVGVVSERDLLERVVCNGLNAANLLVKEVMTRKVFTGSPKMTDLQVAALFARHGVKKLPIVEKNKLVGIITQTDLLKLMSMKWSL